MRAPRFALVMLVVLAACAGQQQPKPAGPPPLPPTGPDCEATCHHQYKECANGSRCMMVQQCDMDVCIPEKADCLAHCSGGR